MLYSEALSIQSVGFANKKNGTVPNLLADLMELEATKMLECDAR